MHANDFISIANLTLHLNSDDSSIVTHRRTRAFYRLTKQKPVCAPVNMLGNQCVCVGKRSMKCKHNTLTSQRAPRRGTVLQCSSETGCACVCSVTK